MKKSLFVLLFVMAGCSGSKPVAPITYFSVAGASGLTVTGVMNPGAKSTMESRKERVTLAVKLLENTKK